MSAGHVGVLPLPRGARWGLTALLAPGFALGFGSALAVVVAFVLVLLWWGRAAGLAALFLLVAALAAAVSTKEPVRAAGSVPAPRSARA
jgi:hypothetical protein